jgi:hypothetical protein
VRHISITSDGGIGSGIQCGVTHDFKLSIGHRKKNISSEIIQRRDVSFQATGLDWLVEVETPTHVDGRQHLKER